ncbi:MAG: DUF3783 domain-containing protein [Spirochaetes bacterium]|nr:DUF3783 domain-containing protein [Spirochaetota bacterium]
MNKLGIMLYGYNETDARLIKKNLESVFDSKIIIFSGSSRESNIVEDIISDEAYDTFEDNELKVLMFLGFDDRNINLALEKFQGADNLTRPIFCGLTENNIGWPLSQLLEHLIEERNYWNNKNKQENN